MEAINELRARHNKPPLNECAECTMHAQRHANRFVFEHGELDGDHGRMGQNIALGGANLTPEKAVKRWASEAKDYPWGTDVFVRGTGHFTQLIWRDTTHVGFGICRRGNQTMIVANFHPAGNINGRFLECV